MRIYPSLSVLNDTLLDKIKGREKMITLKKIEEDKETCEEVELESLLERPISDISKLHLRLFDEKEYYLVDDKYLYLNKDNICHPHTKDLGTGGYGNVISYADLKIAVKVFNRSPNSDNYYNVKEMILAQVAKMSKLFKAYTLICSPNTFGYSMKEYSTCLFKYLNRHRGKHSKDIIALIVREMTKYKKVGIMHRDIKTDNIFLDLDKEGNITDLCIGDWGIGYFEGFSHLRKSERNYKCQTIWYRAPEVVFHDDYDFKADMWSLGCVIYEIVKGKTLITCKGEDDLRETLRDKYGRYPHMRNRVTEMPELEGLPEETRCLLLGLLQPNKKYRLDIEDLGYLLSDKVTTRLQLPTFKRLYEEKGKRLSAVLKHIPMSEYTPGAIAYILAHIREVDASETEIEIIKYISSLMINDFMGNGDDVSSDSFRKYLVKTEFLYIRDHPCLHERDENRLFRLMIYSIDPYPLNILEEIENPSPDLYRELLKIWSDTVSSKLSIYFQIKEELMKYEVILTSDL